jgi:hypothetical protein
MATDKTRTPPLPKIKKKDYQKVHSERISENTLQAKYFSEGEQPFELVCDSVGGYEFTDGYGRKTSGRCGGVVEYTKTGTTLTVDNNGDVKLAGHNRVLMGGGGHIEVTGDAGIAVGGDTAIVGVGKINARAKSVYIGSDGDVSVRASGNMEIKADGIMHLKGSQIRLNSSGGFSS